MLITSGSKSIGETHKICFVYGVQHFAQCRLKNLILQRGDAKWSLSSVSFRYIHSPSRYRLIASALEPLVQSTEVALQLCTVSLPAQSIYPGSSLHVEPLECGPQRLDAKVMQ